MILGIGTDIVEIERIATVVKRQPGFAARILCDQEIAKFKTMPEVRATAFLAKRFAAKEAVSKALGCGIGKYASWHDICISNDGMGKPLVSLSGDAEKHMKTLGAGTIHISISDEKNHAIAYVVIED